nr:putative ribonuclease H-like domain-containing protein [Tanacetum cinerariifolium]
MLTMRAKRFLQKTGRNLCSNGPTSMGFDMSKVECYNCHRKGHFARECRSPKYSRRSVAVEPQRRTVSVKTSTSNALVSQCDGVGSYDWSYQAVEEPANYALIALSSLSSSDNELRDNTLVTLRQKLEKAEQERDDLKLNGGYHAVPTPSTGTFMPPKPDLFFYTAPITVVTDHSAFTIQLSPTKPAQDLSHINKPTAPIIEDWVFDSEDEFETKAPQIVPSFVQSSEQVKTLRHSVQQVKTTILAATPKPASPTSNSSGKKRNRKACFVCKSVDHLIKDLLTQSKPVSITTVRPVSASVPKIKVTRPRLAKPSITKSKSPIRRHLTHSHSPKTDNSPPRVTAVQASVETCPIYLILRSLMVDMLPLEVTQRVVRFLAKAKLGQNSVLFTDTKCLVLAPDFKLPDESQVLLRVPRENNMYNVNLKNIVPSRDLTCLFAKATIDESDLWHRRLAHINFKTLNKLVKSNLVRGLPTKVFKNDNTCVACKKGKQYRATCKTKPVSLVDQPLYMLHIDLFGPTFVKNLNKKSYCLVITDDYSRFTWVFFLATKDETSPILKTFITVLENQLSLKVEVIRSDNRTEFKNNDLNQFCRMKGIKREFSVPRTLQQNGIAERKNMTLIEAAKTMLADSLLPISFWAEAINTACYVQNRVLVTKPHNKTPYKLLHCRTPSKFEGKVNEGFLVGYSVSSKAFRVLNSRTRIVQETLHVNFLENKPNIAGSGPTWLFDIDSLTRTMNYQPVTTGNQTNPSAGFKNKFDAEKAGEEIDQQYMFFPVWSSGSTNPHNNDEDAAFDGKEHDFDAKKPESEVSVSPSSKFEDCSDNSINEVNAAGTIVPTIGHNSPNSNNTFSTAGPSNASASPTYGKSSFIDASQLPNDPDMPELEDITYSDDEDDVGAEADFNNLETSITVSPIPTTRVHKDHSVSQIIGDLSSTTQTRSMTIVEPKRVHQALKDPSWIEAIQEELLQFKMQKEEVYVYQPLGFEDPDHPDKVYKVVKALYGVHQAPRACQDKYVAKILRKFRLTKGKSAITPIDTEKPLLKDTDGEDVDVHTYRSMNGSLMYLTSSRPDIMFVVCTCARFQVTPKASHLHVVKRIFRYLKGKPHLGLRYPNDSPFDLVAYLDNDYAGASLDRKSTTGGCQFLRCRLISWQCKKQTVIATSSIEAEYVAAASCCAQVLWIQNQLLDYGDSPLLGVNTPRSDEDRLELMELTVFLLPNVEKVEIGVNAVDLQVYAVRHMLLLLVQKFLLFSLTNWCHFVLLGHQIIDFLIGSSIKYALTVNPNIYVSYIKQFWTTVAVKQINDVTSLVRNVDSTTKFYMYPRFLQLIIRKQVGDLSTHTTKHASPALTQKIEEEGDADEHVEEVTADDAAHGDDSAAHGEVPTVTKEPSISSPAPPYLPPQPPQDIPLTSKVQQTLPPSPQVQPPSSPQPQQATDFPMSLLQEALDACVTLTKRVEHLEYDKVAQALEITKLKRRVKKLEKRNKVRVLKLRRLQKIRTSQRVETSDDKSNQGRMISMDQDDDVVLTDEKEEDNKVEEVKVDESAQVQGRQAESQAEIYKIDMDHANKVLSMQEDETEPAEVQEMIDVVTTAKLITEVVTAASKTVTAASIIIPTAEPKVPVATLTATLARVAATPSRRKKGVVIRDPEEDSATSTIIPAETKSKIKLDYFKGMSYDDIRLIFKAKFHSNVDFLLKTKEQMEKEQNRALQTINETPAKKAAKRRKFNKEVEELKRHLQIVPNEDDNVYTKATPLAKKVPVVDYEIIKMNNKPYYKIIRVDGTHQLYISFLTLLRNFDKEDLKALWSLVKERFSIAKPKNFSDDFLLTTLGAMFEKPDAHAQI